MPAPAPLQSDSLTSTNLIDGPWTQGTSILQNGASSSTEPAAASTAPEHRAGAPRREKDQFTPEIGEALRSAAHSGASDAQAAYAARIAKSTLCRWKRELPHLAVALNNARHGLLFECINCLMTATTRDGRPDWRSRAWILEHMFPEDYSLKADLRQMDSRETAFEDLHSDSGEGEFFTQPHAPVNTAAESSTRSEIFTSASSETATSEPACPERAERAEEFHYSGLPAAVETSAPDNAPISFQKSDSSANADDEPAANNAEPFQKSVASEDDDLVTGANTAESFHKSAAHRLSRRERRAAERQAHARSARCAS